VDTVDSGECHWYLLPVPLLKQGVIFAFKPQQELEVDPAIMDIRMSKEGYHDINLLAFPQMLPTLMKFPNH